MQNHIPTVHELMGRPEGELRAIFRAAVTASRDSSSTAPRQAAKRTLEVVRRLLPKLNR